MPSATLPAEKGRNVCLESRDRRHREPVEALCIVDAALANAASAASADLRGHLGSAHKRLMTDKLADTAESLRITVDKLTGLAGLIEQLAAERDPTRLLERLCLAARELLGARYAVVAIQERNGTAGWHFHTSGIEEQRLDLEEPDTGRSSLLGGLVRRVDSLRLAPVTQAPDEIGLPTGHPPVGSLVAASLASLHNVYGWICLSDRLEGDSFSSEEQGLLSTLATLAGRIYENVRLYAEARARNVVLEQQIGDRLSIEYALERRIEYEHLVASVSNTLSALSLEVVEEGLDQVLAAVSGFLYADRIAIYLVDDSGETILEAYRWWRPGCQAVGPEGGARYPFGAWLRESLMRDAVVAISSLDELPEEAALERQVLATHGVQSCIGVGLLPSGAYRGFMVASAIRSARQWSKNDQALLKLVGEMLGHFFERRRSHQNQIRLNAELEQRVRARTHELEVANAELESFAYTVSHDLRAPLRTINGFARLIDADYSSKLDDTGREYVGAVVTGTMRMTELIEGLRRLSRVTLTPIQFGRVDLSAVARDVVQDLRRDHPERTVEVTIEERMLAQGDAPLLRDALANLIGNAWKYTGPVDTPRIEIGSHPTKDGTVEYFVRDNGVGFNQAYGEKLFTAFQRLHHAEDFEGTGIGLATVARIIRRHGGATRAEGEVGHGATFSFTLG